MIKNVFRVAEVPVDYDRRIQVVYYSDESKTQVVQSVWLYLTHKSTLQNR